MKWTYLITQKLKAATALAVIFILILITNLIDKKHFSQLQEAFTTVYEDRLLVENYIHKLSILLNEKKISLDKDGEEINQLDHSITSLIDEYEKTKFTTEEVMHFASLKKHLQELCLLEKEYLQTTSNAKDNIKDVIDAQHQKLLYDMEKLSNIQLAESKKIIETSNKIIASSNLNIQLEIGFLIVIGFIIQALIFASKSLKTKFYQESRMN